MPSPSYPSVSSAPHLHLRPALGKRSSLTNPSMVRFRAEQRIQINNHIHRHHWYPVHAKDRAGSINLTPRRLTAVHQTVSAVRGRVEAMVQVEPQPPWGSAMPQKTGQSCLGVAMVRLLTGRLLVWRARERLRGGWRRHAWNLTRLGSTRWLLLSMLILFWF